MSRKTSGASIEGSMDLLLDTICNTFGGVLFISMLVAILISMTSKEISYTPPQQEKQSELIKVTRELESAQIKLANLQQTVSLQDDLSSNLQTRESIILAEKIEKLEEHVVSLQDDSSQIAKEIGTTQTKTNDLAQQIQIQKREHDHLADQIKKIDDELQKEVSSRSRKTNLPLVGDWNNDVAYLYLTENTLCFLNTPDGMTNFKECKIETQLGMSFVSPILSNGIKIQSGTEKNSLLENKIKLYNPNRHMLTIWVTTDSFEAFNSVKNAMVEHGFRYEIKLLNKGDRVYLSNKPIKHRAQ